MVKNKEDKETKDVRNLFKLKKKQMTPQLKIYEVILD